MIKNIAIGFVGFVVGTLIIFAVCLIGNSSDVKADKNFSVKVQYEDLSKSLYVLTDSETGHEYIIFSGNEGAAITPRLK